MRLFLACLLCAVVVLTVRPPAAWAQGAPVSNIQLTAPDDIADASAVNRTISVLVKDVGSCSPAAQGSATCACGFKDDLKKLKDAYDVAVAKHPAWSGERSVVAYSEPSDGKSVTLNFPGIKRQLDACSGR